METRVFLGNDCVGHGQFEFLQPEDEQQHQEVSETEMCIYQIDEIIMADNESC